jgi:hypothetical protein
MTDGEQLQLELDRLCSGCGSQRHHGCGYDPEMVKPAMSVGDAMSATIARAVEMHGWDEATKRIPGLRLWGKQPPADWRPTEAEVQLLRLDEPTPKQRRKA